MSKYPDQEEQKKEGKEYLRQRLFKMDMVHFVPAVSSEKTFEWFEGTSHDVIAALDRYGHFDKLIEIPGYDVGNLESFACTEYPNPYSENERKKVSGQKFIMKAQSMNHNVYHDTKFTYLAVVRTDEDTFFWRTAQSMIST